jgi:putative NADH-flavin reductase
VIAGDVLDSDAVAETILGSDAVISVFGQVKGSPLQVQTEGTRLIVEQMQAQGLTRIVSLSGGGLRDPHDRPKAADHVIRFLLKTLSGRVLADAEGHLRVLEQSGLDWTVVRGPRLTEKPGTGSYRLGWVGLDTGIEISRDDLADFIVTQIDDDRFVRAMPFVSA